MRIAGGGQSQSDGIGCGKSFAWFCSKLAGFEVDDEMFPAVYGKCQIPLGKAEGLAGSGDSGAELGTIFDDHFLTESGRMSFGRRQSVIFLTDR